MVRHKFCLPSLPIEKLHSGPPSQLVLGHNASPFDLCCGGLVNEPVDISAVRFDKLTGKPEIRLVKDLCEYVLLALAGGDKGDSVSMVEHREGESDSAWWWFGRGRDAGDPGGVLMYLGVTRK